MPSKKTPQNNTSKQDVGDPVTDYANNVLAGNIIAGPHVRNACRRHLDDLKSGHERGLHWDLDAVHRIIGFCRDVCKLKEGKFSNQPFIPSDSQSFILGSIFGWKKADGYRRFRRAYVEQGKGNGKSPMAAAIGLYGLVADGEHGAEIYASGKDKTQAFVLYKDAVSMVRQSPALSSKIIMSGRGDFVWNLAYLKKESSFRVLSRDQASSGPRPHFALCDELHEHPDGGVIEMLERGFKSRPQPLLFMITNSGSDRKTVCWEEHIHAVSVAAGVPKELLDDDFTYVGGVWEGSDETFSYVCALDKNDDPFSDPSCWVKANPLLGIILTNEYMESNVAQARDMASKRNGILRLHFCVWTDSDVSWLSRPQVEAVMCDFDPYVEHAGKKIKAAAIDLSATQDLTSAAFAVETGVMHVTRADGTDGYLPTFDVWVESWTPHDTMDARSKVDHTPYRLWNETFHKNAAGEDTDQPYLRTTQGSRVKYDDVAAFIARMDAEFGIEVLAYDNFAYAKFAEELEGYGVVIDTARHPQGGKWPTKASPERIEAAVAAGKEPPQGLWMPTSLRAFEELILDKRCRIRNSPVVLAAIMGATLKSDDLGNQWLDKSKATVRIDPAVAACMCLGTAVSVSAIPEFHSVYETRGLIKL